MKINYDFHIHTKFSKDGRSTMEEHILSAVKKGFKQICFTEHMDFEQYTKFPKKDYLNMKKYIQEYTILKEKYKNQIEIKFGIELGLQPETKKEVQKFLSNYDFDYIIGSLHDPQKEPIHRKTKDNEFFDNCTQKQAYNKYLNEMLKVVKTYKNEYDSIGHLDYITRYGIYEKKKMQYLDHSDIIDKILIEIIENKKGIEINTSGFKYRNEPHPNYDIIKRYISLGGKYITIGSDSHEYKNLGKHFNKIYNFLKKEKVKEITIYDKRKPKMIKI